MDIIAIAGNHDSPARLGAASAVLRELGVHVIGHLPRSASGSIDEERVLVPEDIASLPDREGYLWLKNRSAEAIRVAVADVPIPDGNALMQATSAIRQDAAIGERMSRKQYDQAIASRDRERSDQAPDLATAMTRRYQSTREEGGV